MSDKLQAPTDMLSVEAIDAIQEQILLHSISLETLTRFNCVCAMARRSALSEAAGRVLALSADKLEKWREVARRDDWHYEIVGSDMRQLVEQSIQAIARQADNVRLRSEVSKACDKYEVYAAKLSAAEAENVRLKEQSANEVNWHMQVASELRAQLTAAESGETKDSRMQEASDYAASLVKMADRFGVRKNADNHHNLALQFKVLEHDLSVALAAGRKDAPGKVLIDLGVVQWMLGECEHPETDLWFERPANEGKFWWRKYLRAAIAAPDSGQAGE